MHFRIETQQSMAQQAQAQELCLSFCDSFANSTGDLTNPLQARLNNSAFGEKLYMSFFLSTIFAPGGPIGYWAANKDWMEVALVNQEQNPASALALRCLTTSFFGRTHGQPGLEDDAMKLYGKALLELSRKISIQKDTFDFDTLAATSVLNMYELVVFTCKSGWIQHCGGTARLMEIIGPNAFNDDRHRAVFAMNRYYLINSALITRKKTFLERDEWWKILGSTDPDLIAINELQSIAAKLPGLMEEALRLRAQHPDEVESERSERTKESFLNLLDKLMIWNVSWRELPHRLPKPAQGSDLQAFEGDLENPLYPNLLTYSTLDHASTTCNWNAYMITTLKWLDFMDSPNKQEKHVTVPPVTPIPGILPHVHDICRSIDYHLLPQHLYQGSKYMLYSAHVVFHAMPAQSRLSKWLHGVLDMVSKHRGFAIARGILE